MSFLAAFISFIVGVSYTLAALMLPAAAVGRANEPKIFPLALGLLLISLSLVLMLKERKNIRQKKSASPSQKTKRISPYTRDILLTILNALLYAFLFVRVGYMLSSLLFICLELMLFRGWKKWKSSLFIAFIFSLVMYILFNKLLGVYLPPSPYFNF